MKRWFDMLPFLDLRQAAGREIAGDVWPALTVTLMAIPQGIAYAMIAGLPPAMGLYAAFLPTIIGSLFRSSRHVVTGPTNALSLLVGTAVASTANVDPITTAMLLALMVGVIQLGAGVLRLGVLVDYISLPVVLGYIAGAGVLIGIGQLPNLTETAGARGNVVEALRAWGSHLDGVNWTAIACGASTAVAIIVLRMWRRTIPSALIVLSGWTAAVWASGLGDDLRTIADLAPIPAGLPSLQMPSVDGWIQLIPLAVAATVLSLVESSAVARAISTRSGQRLDLSSEFVGQGLANIAAGFSGAYPTSGSLSRSALNEQSGARTRIAGIYSGVAVGAALLVLGPIVDHTPIAALAGLLLVVAVDLVDVPRIREVIRGRRSDALAFAATVLGTWFLPLDKAIYLGVGISLVMYLRRARLLRITPLCVEADGTVSEGEGRCNAVRVLQVDGQLFFAAASELTAALDTAFADPDTRVVVLRVRRALGMDATIALLLGARAAHVRDLGQRLVLAGLGEQDRALLERTGVATIIGSDNISQPRSTILEGVSAIANQLHDELAEHDCGRNDKGPEPAPRASSSS